MDNVLQRKDRCLALLLQSAVAGNPHFKGRYTYCLIQLRVLKKSVMSFVNKLGCSIAAKCPPAGISVQCCMLNPFSGYERGGVKTQLLILTLLQQTIPFWGKKMQENR
jgi:hypothetical protein